MVRFTPMTSAAISLSRMATKDRPTLVLRMFLAPTTMTIVMISIR